MSAVSDFADHTPRAVSICICINHSDKGLSLPNLGTVQEILHGITEITHLGMTIRLCVIQLTVKFHQV